MSLSEDFARFYGTDNQGNTQMTDEQIKEAMIDLFEKSASESGIDLEKLSADQIRGLYAEWEPEFLKAAAEEGEEKDDEEEEERVEKAKAEHEEKKAALGKYAEADDMGRVMARSFLDELNKEAAGGKGFVQGAKDMLESGKGKVRAAYDRAGELLSGSKVKDEHQKGRWLAAEMAAKGKKEIANASNPNSPLAKNKEVIQKMRDDLAGKVMDSRRRGTTESRKVLGARLGLGAAVAGTGAGATALATRDKKSSFDGLAAELAVEKAAAAGFDPEVCGNKIASLIHLDLLEESEKVAAIDDTTTALHVRASEMLELAGYPVDWNA